MASRGTLVSASSWSPSPTWQGCCPLGLHPSAPSCVDADSLLLTLDSSFSNSLISVSCRVAPCSKVFNHNGEDSLLLELHPNAKMILGSRNIAFMHGPDHTALRKSFLPLFTRRALSTYVRKQDAIIRCARQGGTCAATQRQIALLPCSMPRSSSQGPGSHLAG